MYAAPPVGSKVIVTTRWRSHYAYRTSDYEDHILEGTVVPDVSYSYPNSFRITVDDKIVPEREISLEHVVDLTVDGKPGAQHTGDDPMEPKTWWVPGSKGAEYVVRARKGKYDCSCVGFQYRKHCKHIDIARSGSIEPEKVK